MITPDQFLSLVPQIQSSIHKYIQLTSPSPNSNLPNLLPFYSAYNKDNQLLESIYSRVKSLHSSLYCFFDEDTLINYQQPEDRYKSLAYAQNRTKVSASKVQSASRLFSLYHQLINFYQLNPLISPTIADIGSGCGTLGVSFSLLVNAQKLSSLDINPYFDFREIYHPSFDLPQNLKSVVLGQPTNLPISTSVPDSLSIPDIRYIPASIINQVNNLSPETLDNFLSSSYNHRSVDAIQGLQSLDSASTDIILLLSGLDYYNLPDLVHHISRICSPNGLFFLSTGSFFSPFGSGMNLPGLFPYSHTQYSKSDFLSLMQDCDYPFLDLLNSSYYFKSTHYSFSDIVEIFSSSGFRLIYHYFDPDRSARSFLEQASSPSIFLDLSVTDSGDPHSNVSTFDLESRYFFLGFIKQP